MIETKKRSRPPNQLVTIDCLITYAIGHQNKSWVLIPSSILDASLAVNPHSEYFFFNIKSTFLYIEKFREFENIHCSNTHIRN